MSVAAFAFPLPSALALLRAFVIAGVIALLAACGSSPSGPSGPGYHRVQPNETLSAIARRYGRDVDELVRWNRLANADRIHVGQVLRVAANPGAASDRGIAAGGPADVGDAGRPAGGSSQVKPSAPAPRATAAVPANAV